MKTVRFTQVVERSGRPHVHAFWVDPSRDTEFQRARKADRVMTIGPSDRGKADVGLVGFDSAHQRGSQILIFPKSLKPFDGCRVIGIKFELVAQPPSTTAGEHEGWNAAPRQHRPRPAKSPPTVVTRSTRRSARPSQSNGVGASSPPPARSRPAPPDSAPAPSHRHRPQTSARRSTDERAGRDRIPTEKDLVRDIRAAMADLRAGRAVAAYQRLEHAIDGQ